MWTFCISHNLFCFSQPLAGNISEGDQMEDYSAIRLEAAGILMNSGLSPVTAGRSTEYKSSVCRKHKDGPSTDYWCWLRQRHGSRTERTGRVENQPPQSLLESIEPPVPQWTIRTNTLHWYFCRYDGMVRIEGFTVIRSGSIRDEWHANQ